MKRKTLEYFQCDGDSSISIPFDNDSSGRYEAEIYPEAAELGDGIVLAADREGFAALAKVFAQLATGDYSDGFHVHLGWRESDGHGAVGLRIVLSSSGRITRPA